MIHEFFFYSLQRPSFLFDLRRVASRFPPPTKPRRLFARLKVHVAIMIGNEQSANGNSKSCFSVEINAGSSRAGRAGDQPVTQELSCLAG